jgi:hypothetical protein
MSEVSVIGLDLAKHVFPVQGADAEQSAALRLGRSTLSRAGGRP